MTTPATYNTCERIIRDGMKDAGKLQRGQDPDSEDFADGINTLNDIINYEQINGLKVWLQEFRTIPLVVNKAVYSMGPGGDVDMVKPTKITAGQYVDQFTKSRPLTLLSREEYARLNDKVTAGAINSFWPDKQRSFVYVSLWYPPDVTAATGSVSLTIQRQCTTMISLTDEIDFPPEWTLFLHWAMSCQLATGQPKSIRDRADTMYMTMREQLANWDVEDADVSFQMDMQSNPGQGQFR